MVESTLQRNALARVQQALEQDKIPKTPDIRLVEQMTTMEAFETLDKLDALKQQKSHQATSQQSTDQSQPTPKKPPATKISPDFEGLGHSGGGSSEPTTERKRPLTGREKDYFNFFNQRFGPLIVLILYFAMADLDKAVFYAPSPDECREVAPHLARIGPKVEDLVHLPKWAHEVIVTSDSTFTVGMILVGYFDRIGVLEKILPWMQSTTSKFEARRKEREQPQTNTGNISSNGTGGAPGPDTTRQYPSLEQLGVDGIGQQDRAEP